VFDRFNRSVTLVKASWGVLRSDKELVIFPAVSFVLTVIVTIGFIIPFYLTGALERTADRQVDPVAVVLGFLYYLVTYTVIIFCNTALVGAALIRLEGRDPTLRDGFRIAWSRISTIIGYALISATVGMILRAISERGGIVGQIAASIIGIAWGIVTFLVIPVLVVEGLGPIAAIKRSGSLLRQTWGEQVVGNVGIGLVFGIIAILAILVGIAITALLAAISPVLAIASIVLTVLVVAAIALVGAALSGIFMASVYRYTTKGDGGSMFPTATLQQAFRPKS
jgi:hypothetical protein